MAEKQVEVVRKHIEAFQAEDVAGALSFQDLHVVMDVSRTAIDEDILGRKAVEDYIRRYVGTFADYRYEVERLTDLGPGAVLAVVTEAGRGKGSGVPVNRSFAVLYTVIDGKIARFTTFRTEQDALEAIGLSG